MDSVEEGPVEQQDTENTTDVIDTVEEVVTKKGFKLPKFLKSKGFIASSIVLVSLLAIMYLAFYVRSGTLDSPTVLDYDPWWFFRHAQEILDSNMIAPAWDELSHFPPGRPYEAFQGWSYTLAILYKILNPLIGFTLTEVAKWSTIIFAAAAVIPAFLLGRKLSDKWGGVTTAIFAVLTPTLIGVSMAGYCDSDMVVAFYSFLTVYSILLAMSKKLSVKAIPYYVLAILINLAFAYTWGYGWIILLFFTAFIPAILIFRLLEELIHNRGFRVDLKEVMRDKNIIVPLLIIIIVTNLLGALFNLGHIIEVSGLGAAFTQGELLLVNISVAELQTVDIFTRAGLESVIGRVGLGPIVFTFSLPLLVIYKLYRKEKINFAEVFLFLWIVVTFFLIQYGVRFSILFSTAAAVTAGYVIGNAPKYLNKKLLKATFFGLTAVLIVLFVSDAVYTGYATGSMEISGNWYAMLDWINEKTDQDALIVTWWDPGHIIAGYTGHRVMGDGAHCDQGVGSCLPYGHDIRIQDMGRVFSISDEDEAISILEKYKGLTTQQCDELKEIYGSKFPADACDPIPEMYVIASSDLIQKYYWLSYFGTGTGRSYWQMPLTDYDQAQGILTYAGGQLSLVYQENGFVPVFNLPEQGIRNALVSQVVYFENNQQKHFVFNETQAIDGMVWVEPGFSAALFIDPQTRDSIFNRMYFFNGEGLEHFELVYQNPEIKLFKVIW